MSRIHEYLPETLKDVIDLKLLNEDLDIELEQLDGYITGIGKEVIVKSASLYGIEKWEKALGITPKDGDSLETRRFRVNNLLTSKLPYTYRWLIKKLTQITGSPSGYTLNINQADYAITIVLSGLDTNMMIEVQKQLRNAIPSNMVLEIGGPPLVSADIKVGMALRIGTKYKIPSGYGNGDSDIPLGKNLLNSDFDKIDGAMRGTAERYGNGFSFRPKSNESGLKYVYYYLDPAMARSLLGQDVSVSCDIETNNTNGPNIKIYWGNIATKALTTSIGMIRNIDVTGGGSLHMPSEMPEGVETMAVIFYLGYGGETSDKYMNITNIQFERGNEVTEYEPFIGF